MQPLVSLSRTTPNLRPSTPIHALSLGAERECMPPHSPGCGPGARSRPGTGGAPRTGPGTQEKNPFSNIFYAEGQNGDSVLCTRDWCTVQYSHSHLEQEKFKYKNVNMYINRYLIKIHFMSKNSKYEKLLYKYFRDKTYIYYKINSLVKHFRKRPVLKVLKLS